MTELHDPVLVFPQLIFEGRYLALADIDGVVDFKKYRLRLLLVLLLELQVGDELLSVLMLSVQVERHVVHRLLSASLRSNTLVHDILTGFWNPFGGRERYWTQFQQEPRRFWKQN